MTVFVALLRAVNVGGTGKLAMSELRRLCEDAGFESVRAYIASGNVVFRASGPEARVKATLQAALAARFDRAPGVLLRSAAQLSAVAAANPFPDAAPNRTVVIFLDAAPGAQALQGLRHQRDEQVAAGKREIYVHYGAGMAQSKLVIPAARDGTARNLNTVAALARLATDLEAAGTRT